MPVAYNPDPNVRLLEGVFVARITAKSDASGEWRYAWTEQKFDLVTGAYDDADPPRFGTLGDDADAGESDVAYATELRGLELAVPGLYWCRLKGAVDEQLVYEVVGGGSSFSATVGDGASSSLTVTHNLGSRDVSVIVRQTTTPYEFVYPTISAPTADTLTLTFASPPSSGEYTVVVIPRGGGPPGVDGPGTSTDNGIVRWDGTTGTTVQNGPATIDDSGNLTLGPGGTTTTVTGGGPTPDDTSVLVLRPAPPGTTTETKLTLTTTETTFTRTGTETTTVNYPVRVIHLTTGTPGAGFGTSIWFGQDNGAGNLKQVGALEWPWVDPGDGVEDGALVVKLVEAGAIREALRVPAPGIIRLPEYPGTPATPDAGYSIIYPKSDGKLYSKDDAGTETPLFTAATTPDADVYSVAYNHASLNVAGTTATVAVVTLPAKTYLLAAVVRVKTAFASSGALSALTVQLRRDGNTLCTATGGTTANDYAQAGDSSPYAGVFPTFTGTSAVTLVFNSTGANLNTLTAGEAEAYLLAFTLP